ncbi:hypothetical protein SETIT_1G049300v2 [Setaria italica]|uniref:Protein kinase domain-containing protein n=1 Tax=Setaria italica TaxID=4555 RepID=K3YZS0_SETIT|nr:hypothetical protein SETIT_1G049300v2 [Setaria italica]
MRRRRVSRPLRKRSASSRAAAASQRARHGHAPSVLPRRRVRAEMLAAFGRMGRATGPCASAARAARGSWLVQATKQETPAEGHLHGRSLVHEDVKPANVVLGAARGEEQGPAADVWALGCTVIVMATGRASWSDVGGLLAAVHRIGYTDAVPEVPAWMSTEAKNFLPRCFARNPRDQCTAAQLLEHPFLASVGCGVKAEEVPAR